MAHRVLLVLLGVGLGVALTLAALWLRRLVLLRSRPGSVRARLGFGPDGPFRAGFATYSPNRLTWWPRFSLGGGRSFPRDQLAIVARDEAAQSDPTGRPMLRLTCVLADGPRLYLVLGAPAAAGLTSWLEAGRRIRPSV